MKPEFAPITGDEFQVEGFQKAYHQGDDMDDFKESVINSLQKVYEGEMSHKIIRVNHRLGTRVFMFSAGTEKEMYNEVVEWLQEVSERDRLPLVFEFRNFVSFTAPALHKG